MRDLTAAVVMYAKPTKDNEDHRSKRRVPVSYFYGLCVDFLFTQTVLLFIVATIHLHAS